MVSPFAKLARHAISRAMKLRKSMKDNEKEMAKNKKEAIPRSSYIDDPFPKTLKCEFDLCQVVCAQFLEVLDCL